MNADEAAALIEAFEGHWNKKLEQGTKATWMYAFEAHHYRVVVQAIQYLAVRAKFPPSLAEMVEVITMYERESGRDTKRLEAGSCRTCGGDKLVLYSMRPAETSQWAHDHGRAANGSYEEYVPCPDCNAGAEASFRRQDGTRYVPPDPGLVRERVSKCVT